MTENTKILRLALRQQRIFLRNHTILVARERKTPSADRCLEISQSATRVCNLLETLGVQVPSELQVSFTL